MTCADSPGSAPDENGSALDQPAETQTTCCIVGAGPAGTTLAWLLARQGIAVTLLERHDDFERDFRGDTLHPGVLETLEEMGLAERVLALPHTRMRTLSFHTARETLMVADLGRLKTKFPFVALLPQSLFLATLAQDARRFASFDLIMGAEVRELIEVDGVIRGVRYVDGRQGKHEITADLTIAADGRSTRLRRAAGLEAIPSAPEIDVLWFRLPRREHQDGGGYLAAGSYMIVLHRGQEWQIGYVIRKGRYAELRGAGIAALRESVAKLAPGLADSAAQLTDWRQVRLLSVQADRLRTWYRAGLLFLGDAAHVMSPVGGVGVNYAIQDAVEAANLLVNPLRDKRLTLRDLRAVQRRREWPTRLVQAVQAFDQKYLIEQALRSTNEYRLPLWLRLLFGLPIVRWLPTRLFAFGLRRVRVGPVGT